MIKLLKCFLCFFIPMFSFGQQNILFNEHFKVYNEIYSLLKNNYPLFQYRSYYNLDSAYDKHKPEILQSTTEDELANFCCEMIGGLEDFHVRIFTGSKTCFALSKPLHWHQIFYNDSLQQVFWKNSDSTLYKSKLSKLKNTFYDDGLPMIRYSKSKNVGYLNITRFEVGFGKDFLSKDSIQLSRFMDSVVQEFNGMNAIIIDLRSCMGGLTEYGEIIAGKFTKEKRQYSTTVRFKNINDSLPAIKHYIKPSGPEQLNLPIIILTNKVVRSAAEDFILMLKQLPNIYIIGEPTWGAFANSEVHNLSNGWKLQLPNEKVYSVDGEIYEGKGIPVDYLISNNWDDIVSKNDKVLKEAFAYIQMKKFK